MFASARVIVNLCTHYCHTCSRTSTHNLSLSLSLSLSQRVCKNPTVAEKYFKQCLLINPRYLHANCPKLSETCLMLHNSQKHACYP